MPFSRRRGYGRLPVSRSASTNVWVKQLVAYGGRKSKAASGRTRIGIQPNAAHSLSVPRWQIAMAGAMMIRAIDQRRKKQEKPDRDGPIRLQELDLGCGRYAAWTGSASGTDAAASRKFTGSHSFSFAASLASSTRPSVASEKSLASSATSSDFFLFSAALA